MHVTLFGVVLFLHITVAIIAFMLAGVLHAALGVLARARDVRDMRSWTALVHRIEPLLPVMALILLGFGAWLIHLSGKRFAWSDGWVSTSVVALIVVEALSGALIAPRSKAMTLLVNGSPDGPVPDELTRATRDPIVWHLAHVATFGFAGVVFLMAVHPTGFLSPVIVVLAAALGVAVSAAQLRPLDKAPATSGGVVSGHKQPAGESV
jgi:hypothetical protein